MENQENESTETSEEEYDRNGKEINGFGIIPFILKFCEVTNHTFSEAMNYDISTLFYIVTYEVIKAKKQEQQIKQLQRRNGNNR